MTNLETMTVETVAEAIKEVYQNGDPSMSILPDGSSVRMQTMTVIHLVATDRSMSKTLIPPLQFPHGLQGEALDNWAAHVAKDLIARLEKK